MGTTGEATSLIREEVNSVFTASFESHKYEYPDMDIPVINILVWYKALKKAEEPAGNRWSSTKTPYTQIIIDQTLLEASLV